MTFGSSLMTTSDINEYNLLITEKVTSQMNKMDYENNSSATSSTTSHSTNTNHSQPNLNILITSCLVINNQTGVERVNFTLECFKYKFTSDFKFGFLTCLFLFIIALDIFLNLTVLLSILIEKFKTRVDICFMSNAFADLIMGLVIMPFTAMYTLFGYFPFNQYICFMWNCLDFTAGTTSMLHLALISFDRYLSVSKPLKYTNKQRTDNKFSVHGIPTSLILVFIWFFSSAAWIPVLLYFKSNSHNSNFLNKDYLPSKINENYTLYDSLNQIPTYHDHQRQCLSDCSIDGSPTIVLPHSFIVYYIPMFIIIYFYSKTIKIVNDKMKRRRSSSLSYSSNRSSSIKITSNLNKNCFFYMFNKKCCFKFCNFDKNFVNKSPSVQTQTQPYSQINNHIQFQTPQIEIYTDDVSLVSKRRKSELPDGRLKRMQLPAWTSLENNLNKSLENSKHLNQLNIIKSSFNKTFSSSLNLNITQNGTIKKELSPCTINQSNKSGILKNPNSISNNLNKTLSFKINKNYPNTETTTKPKISTSINFRSASTCSTNILTKKEKNVTYKLGMIMITFIFSWFPFCLLWPLLSLCNNLNGNCYISENFYIFSFWLAYLNSIFTPLILLYNNNKYRKSIFLVKNLILHLLYGKKNRTNSINKNNSFILNSNKSKRSAYESQFSMGYSCAENSLIRRASFNV